MTLPQKIKLIDDLIRENRDAEIWEYLAAVQEIETIEKTQTDMGSRKGIPNLTEEQKKEIIDLVKEKTPVAEICGIMGVSENAVYTSCRTGNRSIRQIKPKKAAKTNAKPIERPVAVYSNSSPWGIASGFNRSL